jgi:DNA-binding CsgD family transcriptional regulator
MGSWDLGTIEATFADAALDAASWVKALDTVTALTDSFGAILLPYSGGPISHVPFTESMGPAAEIYFRDGWYQKDERNTGISIMLERGVVDDLDTFSFDRIKRHPYYQEFLAPAGLRWFAGVRVACGEDIWCLSVQRTIQQGPFSKFEKRQLAKLSSRLSTSAALVRALSSASADGALHAFEVSSTAVVLINRHGEVFKANKSAERLLTGDVRIVKRHLVAKDRQATAALNRALHELIWSRGGGGLSSPLPLPRAGHRSLIAYPAKFSNSAANALADCQALVVLVDPDKRRSPAEAAVRAAFGLTGAEARLASRLASGEALETAAAQIGIAKETGRNQLKSIFAKVGVHRQAELVNMLASLPGSSDSETDQD